MSKDQTYGGLILLLSVIITIVYLAAFFGPVLGYFPDSWRQWAIGVPVLLAVLAALVISGWIGYTMLTTPPPAPLEPEPTPPTSAAAETKSESGERK